MKREVELHVGSKRIPLNLFAKEIITNVMLGIVGSLKGVAPELEISLRIGAGAEAGGPGEEEPESKSG
jgi:hypothetical protein